MNSSWSPPSESPLPLHLAGSLVRLRRGAGGTLAAATPLAELPRCQVVLNQFDHPGSVHVYRTACPAGTRLRVQLLTPVLAAGRALSPAVALLAQGIPSGDPKPELPISAPAGYGTQTVASPRLQEKIQVDTLTGAGFFPGRALDTRALVGGHAYVVVWSPDNLMGKYGLQIGHAPVHDWGQWLLVPWIWWRVRGWFGLQRAAAYVVVIAGLLLLFLALTARGRRGRGPLHDSSPRVQEGLEES